MHGAETSQPADGPRGALVPRPSDIAVQNQGNWYTGMALFSS